ncbi:unnamed protein product [Acanthosepion pharaonis]|uniref:VWFA domain-containing protein n=1 Tax=Acanthosepion pharaonis TaxID=158019 RepID=A0A812DL90_ACAPH|nr:unnamed protein product [Sepia pharaonis]
MVFLLCLLLVAVHSDGLKTQPPQSLRDRSSTIIFGYDLLSMGEYRASKISRFINSLLPYTGYGYYKVLSYAYCPENFNIPVTSLMNKNHFDVQRSITSNINVPGLAEVVRQIRSDLYARANQNKNAGFRGSEVAVIFIDPSVTVITPEVLRETEKLKQQGSKLFVVSVGQKECCLPNRFYSLAGRANTFTYPTYKQLLYAIPPLKFRGLPSWDDIYRTVYVCLIASVKCSVGLRSEVMTIVSKTKSFLSLFVTIISAFLSLIQTRAVTSPLWPARRTLTR